MVNHGVSFDDVSYASNTYHSGNPPNGWFAPGETFDGWISLSGEQGAEVDEVLLPDPSRDIASYMAMMGLESSLEAFMAEARQQRKGYWRDEFTAAAVNAYIREGFGMPADGVEELSP